MAYATEEILRVLVLAGAAVLSLSIPIGLAIVVKDNLGTFPGLTAAAALLIDYVLTVAVSVAAGVAAITSALPWLLP